MGKAIGYGVLILLLVGAWSFLMVHVGYSMHKRQVNLDGLMGAKGRALLQRAVRIMGSIGVSPSIDDPEILRPVTRDAVDRWIKDYYKESKT